MKPDYVFVTGWNEWMMGQYKEPWVRDPDSTQLAMVDQFDREHSRDIEPDKDGYLDMYYLQLADNIRRFKGAKQRQKVSEPKTIAEFSDFDGVTPSPPTAGICIHRDYPAWGHVVKKRQRRNEIIARRSRGIPNTSVSASNAPPL